jgi:hypothetical protein
MITVLTICSSNYLAQAKTLGQSVAAQDPAYKFVIGLVDRIPKELQPAYWHPFEIIPVEDLAIPRFDEMVEKYDIVELNTAVKPFYIEHLYHRDPDVSAVIYLDPDILVVSSLEPIAQRLREYSLVLTPHSCTYDHTPTNLYYEQVMLRTGIFNLGFIGTARGPETFAFLGWWQRRLTEYCYARWRDGLFVDQLWAILALVYVRNVWIETGPGYNMCYWNLFERSLTRDGDRFIVNGRDPLVFYHFSSYRPASPEAIVTRGEQPVPLFSERPDLKPLFDEYQTRLLDNQHPAVSTLKCYFVAHRAQRKAADRRLKAFVRKGLTRALLLLPVAVRRPLLQVAWFVVSYAQPDREKSPA